MRDIDYFSENRIQKAGCYTDFVNSLPSHLRGYVFQPNGFNKEATKYLQSYVGPSYLCDESCGDTERISVMSDGIQRVSFWHGSSKLWNLIPVAGWIAFGIVRAGENLEFQDVYFDSNTGEVLSWDLSKAREIMRERKEAEKRRVEEERRRAEEERRRNEERRRATEEERRRNEERRRRNEERRRAEEERRRNEERRRAEEERRRNEEQRRKVNNREERCRQEEEERRKQEQQRENVKRKVIAGRKATVSILLSLWTVFTLVSDSLAIALDTLMLGIVMFAQTSYKTINAPSTKLKMIEISHVLAEQSTKAVVYGSTQVLSFSKVFIIAVIRVAKSETMKRAVSFCSTSIANAYRGFVSGALSLGALAWGKAKSFTVTNESHDNCTEELVGQGQIKEGNNEMDDSGVDEAVIEHAISAHAAGDHAKAAKLIYNTVGAETGQEVLQDCKPCLEELANEAQGRKRRSHREKVVFHARAL